MGNKQSRRLGVTDVMAPPTAVYPMESADADGTLTRQRELQMLEEIWFLAYGTIVSLRNENPLAVVGLAAQTSAAYRPSTENRALLTALQYKVNVSMALRARSERIPSLSLERFHCTEAALDVIIITLQYLRFRIDKPQALIICKIPEYMHAQLIAGCIATGFVIVSFKKPNMIISLYPLYSATRYGYKKQQRR